MQNVTDDNPSLIAEIEMFNTLSKKLKKAPLDNEKFYSLFDGRNLNQTLEERKQYLYLQEKGEIQLNYFKVNQSICLNKYGSGRGMFHKSDICTGVWGNASFFNHDCLPNTSHFGISDYIFIFTVNKIDKNEEITSSYCQASEPYDERQEKLNTNWRFKCKCQLCVFQEKKNDIEYNNYVKLFYNEDYNKISLDSAKHFEEYLGKKKYSCYELANGYLHLEKYYSYLKDYTKTKQFSELVTKYADGKNYRFQLNNLLSLFYCICSCHNDNQFFVVFNEIVKYLKKYTPLSNDEIKYIFQESFDNL